MKKIFLPILFLFFATSASAQSGNDVEDFIDDILLVAGEFSDPAADGAAYQASAGWFSSAEALQKWDFRLSIHGNALVIPSKRKTFGLTNSQLKLLQIEGSETAALPTAFGGVDPTMLRGNINFFGQEVPVEFDAIDGIGRDYIPHAFVQLAVGLSAGTEVTVRAMPKVTIDGVTASTYGIGAKHSLSQYFNTYGTGGVEVALGAAYSKLVVEYNFEPQGAAGIVMLDQIDVDANLFMAELMASKRFGLFELFGAIGAMNSSFDYTFDGEGDYLNDVNRQVDSLEDTSVQFKGDLGFNIHFDRFRISAVGTFGEFYNANLGLHVRI